jgi:hydrogenase maturation protease
MIQSTIAVVGLGNVLIGDDALGPTVVQTLAAQYDVDPCVQLLDLGTPGLDLLPHVSGIDALIVVDTVRVSGSPGEVRVYRKEQLLAKALPQRVAGHDPGLKDTLLTLELTGSCPRDVLLVGVIPESVQTRIGLMPSVRAAVPTAMEAVLAEMKRLGCPGRARPKPLQAGVWWERPIAH